MQIGGDAAHVSKRWERADRLDRRQRTTPGRRFLVTNSSAIDEVDDLLGRTSFA
jgi:hypothetical protein